MPVGDNTNALVYCDLIAPQFIGTNMVRFLRAFNTTWPADYDTECSSIVPHDKFGQDIYIFIRVLIGEISVQFIDNVYYVTVEKRMFRDIRIEILNLTVERVAFTDSMTPLKVVLHFRRVITH